MKSIDELVAQHNNNIFKNVEFFAMWLSPALCIISLIADYTIMKESFRTCLMIRFSMLPISFFAARCLNVFTDFGTRQIISFLYVLANAAVFLPLIYLSDGFYSSYFAGLMLVLMGSLGFLPFNKFFTTCIYSLIIIAYYVVCFAKNGVSEDTILMMVTNTLFLSGAAILAVYVRMSFSEYENNTSKQRTQLGESKNALEKITKILGSLNGKLAENQAKLETTLAEREQVIAEKTEENIHLHFLKSHFSPQVIEHLNVNSTTMARSEVCVMFLDIVDSTNRINSIDEIKFNRVITTFIDESTKILLKHNVTIDKFLGDGIVAYTNHPIKQDGYLALMCRAALDIHNHFLRHQEQLSVDWEGKFEIRIGLAHGSANIGSFGTITQHYTGIGGVFNLAQRVCSAALASRIYITDTMSQALDPELFLLRPTADVKLKGFSEQTKLFELAGVIAPAAITVLSTTKPHT